MRILLIITDYGSFNNFLSELSIALSDRKHEVHVVSSKENIINIKDKADYHKYNIIFHDVSIPREISFIKLMKSAYQLNKLIKSIRPNLVHSHFTTANFPTLLLRLNTVAYWGTFHGLGMNASKGLKRIIFSVVEYFCFLRLDRIFLVNNKDLNLVQRYFPKKTIKYTSYGFGCDIKKFDKLSLDHEFLKSLRRQLNINNEFVIIYTGRYVQFKGFDIVFKSFNELNKTYPNQYKLLLIGGVDPIHDTGLDTKELTDLEHEPSIINVGYSSEVNKYLAIADLFLFPSKKEGLPTCIVESLAMGLPVITLNERGNSDIITHNYNGILINSSNLVDEITNIVKAIRDLTLNKDLQTELSKNALINRNNYDRQKFIDEHLVWYEEFEEKSIHNNNE